MALRIQRQEAVKREAEAARAKRLNRVANGAEAEPAEMAAATDAIAEAEARTAMLQEAIASADAEVKRAEQGVARVLRAELARLAPLAKAEAAAANRLWQEMQERWGVLDVLASELQCASANGATRPAEAEALLRRSAELGIG